MKKVVAVTGGIGSGKSSVIKYLSEMGYPVFSCDKIYREVITTPAYIHKIANTFPECVKDEQIDRKLLAKTVFQDEQKLTVLNRIAHPLIMENLFEQIRNCESVIVFAEVPLLFEGNYEKQFDSVIVVLRNKEERIRSIMQRDNISKEEALQRIELQFDYDNPANEVRFQKCNAIFIRNDKDLSDLKFKIQTLIF